MRSPGDRVVPAVTAAGGAAIARQPVKGLVALVTGVTAPPAGIIAEGLRRRGAVVVSDDAGDRSQGRGRAACDARVPLDPADDLSWDAALFDVVERFGRLDVLVNAAGASPVEFGRTAPGQRLFATNLAGACRGTIHAMHVMRPGGHAGRGGVVINVAPTGAGAAQMAAAALSAASEAADRQSRAARWGVRVVSLVADSGASHAALLSAVIEAIGVARASLAA